MTPKQNLSIGIFVVVALASAAILVLVFGSSDALRTTYTLSCRMQDLGGPVNKGAPLRLMGVPIGKLTDVKLVTGNDPHVLLTMKVHDDVVILDSSQLRVENDGLVGDRILSIVPGNTGQPLSDGDQLKGETPISLRETIQQAQTTVAKLEGVIDELTLGLGHVNSLLGSEQFVADIHGSATEIHQSSKRAREVLDNFSAMSTDLKIQLNDLTGVTKSAVENLDSKYGSLADSSRRVVERIEKDWGSVDNFIQGLNSTRSRIDSIVSKIENGQGTVGRLISEDELLDELQATVVSVQRFIKGVRDDPSQLVWGPDERTKRPLSLTDIRRMIAAEVDPRTIALQIEATGQSFELSAKQIAELKNEGWHDRILEAVVASGMGGK